MPGRRIGVCFVCLGNICRSPTAEGIFLSLLDARGLSERVFVDSAGTSDWHAGEAPDARSLATARSRGIELPSRARVFTLRDFDVFDYVLAMDHSNREELLALAPSAAAMDKVHLFRVFDPQAGEHAIVPDPYAGGPRGFDEVFDICYASALGFLEYLSKNHGFEK